MTAARRAKGPLERATDLAVRKAKAEGVVGPLDMASVEAMRALARKIDAWDQIVQYALDDIAGMDEPRGARPAVPQNDNVSLASYLKYAEQLGLTPFGRGKLPEQKSGGAGGKLRGLPTIPRPA